MKKTECIQFYEIPTATKVVSASGGYCYYFEDDVVITGAYGDIEQTTGSEKLYKICGYNEDGYPYGRCFGEVKFGFDADTFGEYLADIELEKEEEGFNPLL